VFHQISLEAGYEKPIVSSVLLTGNLNLFVSFKEGIPMKNLLGLLTGILVVASTGNAGTYSGGSGTWVDPFKISTTADWQVLTTKSGDWGKHFLLTTDLDFGGASLTPISPDTDLSKSGFQGTAFTGIFDGGGHILRNAVMNLPAQDNVGIFGNVGVSGQIRKMGVENITVSGRYSVGGLAGGNEGTIISCFTNATVTGAGLYAGGLVGLNSGTVSVCYALGPVSSVRCVGGLAGGNTGTVDTCYSAGQIGEGTYVGGLIGWGSGSVTSSFWDTDTSGQTSSSGGTGKPTSYMNYLTTFTTAGWDFSDTDGDPADWAIPIRVYMVEYYPNLNWQNMRFIGSGTEEDPYQIRTKEDWLAMATLMADWDRSWILTTDLDYAITDETYETIPRVGGDKPDILPFTGTFNGNGHVILNCLIDDAIFSQLGPGGKIQNLGVVNSRPSYYSYGVSMLCGTNIQGTISRCFTIFSPSFVELGAGLCLDNIQGVIVDCCAQMLPPSQDWEQRMAGVVFYNHQGRVIHCYSAGPIMSLCPVHETGGIYEDTGNFWEILPGYPWDYDVMGSPQNIYQMKTRSTFTDAGWDFENVWDIVEGQSYPFLRRKPSGDLNHDGRVDLLDFVLFSGQWMKGM
jgi:hypothetical protein